MNIELPAVYPITDRRLSGLSHAELVRKFAAAGATLVQLRDKDATPREFYEQAAAAVAAGRELDVKVVVNDRVDIALAAGADGVHLGQDDLSPVSAREILGADAIIGSSTHTIEQAKCAVELPVDYIAFGPVFATSTKSDAEAVVGLRLLAEVRKTIGEFPLVAIGGINAENIANVLQNGADSAAVISALYGNNPVQNLLDFQNEDTVN